MSASTHLVMPLLRFVARLIPVAPLESVTNLGLEELRLKYKVRDRWLTTALLSALILLALFYFFLLDWAADWCLGGWTGAAFLLRTPRALFAFFAVFMSMTSSLLLVFAILRTLLGRDEYKVYMTYGSHAAKRSLLIDYTKLSLWMFLLIFVPLSLLAALSVDYYTAFTDRAIVDNQFWSLGVEVEHPYTSVQGIYDIRGRHLRFEDKVEPYEVIVFTDGTTWQSERDSGGPEQRRIMEFVAQKSGQKVEAVNFFEDIPADKLAPKK